MTYKGNGLSFSLQLRDDVTELKTGQGLSYEPNSDSTKLVVFPYDENVGQYVGAYQGPDITSEIIENSKGPIFVQVKTIGSCTVATETDIQVGGAIQLLDGGYFAYTENLESQVGVAFESSTTLAQAYLDYNLGDTPAGDPLADYYWVTAPVNAQPSYVTHNGWYFESTAFNYLEPYHPDLRSIYYSTGSDPWTFITKTEFETATGLSGIPDEAPAPDPSALETLQYQYTWEPFFEEWELGDVCIDRIRVEHPDREGRQEGDGKYYRYRQTTQSTTQERPRNNTLYYDEITEEEFLEAVGP